MPRQRAELDNLPSELKLKVLHALQDRRSLSNLVHASPTYHAVYTTEPEAILTTLTLSVLKSRGVNILAPCPIAVVQFQNKHVDKVPMARKCSHFIKSGVMEARAQHRSGKPMKLSIHQCIALLTVVMWDGYNFKADLAARGRHEIEDPPLTPGMDKRQWKLVRPETKGNKVTRQALSLCLHSEIEAESLLNGARLRDSQVPS